MTARQRVTFGLKVAFAYGLYFSGVLRLWQRMVMRRKAVVLMYHRVLTADEQARTASHPALVVDRQTFAMHMSVLKRHFSVLSVEQFAECMERRIPFPDSTCVITFDDGWRDNFTNALPILKEHGLPALVFLPVNYVGQRRLFWQEALTHLLLRAIDESRRAPERRQMLARLLAPVGLEGVLELPDSDPRPAVVSRIDVLKRHDRASVCALLDAIATALGVRLADLTGVDSFIDWSEADVMSRQGIQFGGHGAEHLLLTQVSDEAAEQEIRAAKTVIDEKLNERVLTFSYPNGYLTPAIAAKVRACGYRLAFITKRGFVSCDDDPFTVKRLNVHESVTRSTPMFLARVVGIL